MSPAGPILDASPPRRVLVVEDDELSANTLMAQLSTLGCTVETTRNASEFLGRLLQPGAEFDLAIVDVHLPGLVGTDAITWIRQSENSDLREIPVLVVTGFPLALPPDFCDDHAPCQVLPKPFRLAELRMLIEEFSTAGQRTRLQ